MKQEKCTVCGTSASFQDKLFNPKEWAIKMTEKIDKALESLSKNYENK